MKAREFLKKHGDTLISNIYYIIDDGGNVGIDEESMREEFEEQIKKLLEDTDLKDELQKTMEEKLKQIKEKKNA